MKAEELRNRTATELSDDLSSAKAELFNLRFQMATNQLDNTARLRAVRKDIARILTVMREQEIEAWRVQQAEGSPDGRAAAAKSEGA